ncbi:uncharacterized protein LOC126265720 [Aethina tumida]|uniref:uncharacterized protein LOC126265720 n=1 Tax=Aethina tumida TaxID=116153 RepID=UPI002148D592|nr:uncharacterized protein LOC126265720 [Aethina tumida]
MTVKMQSHFVKINEPDEYTGVSHFRSFLVLLSLHLVWLFILLFLNIWFIGVEVQEQDILDENNNEEEDNRTNVLREQRNDLLELQRRYDGINNTSSSDEYSQYSDHSPDTE